MAAEEEGGELTLLRRRTFLVSLAALILLGLGAYGVLHLGTTPLGKFIAPRPYSRESFDAWRTEDPKNTSDFKEFASYLTAHEVGGVVPAWQLTRTDSQRSNRCKRPEFIVPPRELWPRIVPVLKLVRDEIAPAIGPLEAVSAYRTLDFNGCIGGASRSKHMGFSAVDFIAPRQPDSRTMFAKLCAIQRRLGPSSRFGLGAYFDPAKPRKNVRGRFHVDVAGFRNWGPSYRAASSGCNSL